MATFFIIVGTFAAVGSLVVFLLSLEYKDRSVKYVSLALLIASIFVFFIAAQMSECFDPKSAHRLCWIFEDTK